MRGRTRGFTLIELMITLTILVVVLAGIFQVFESQHKAVIIQQEVAEAQQNVRVALQVIGDELGQATSFETADASDVKFKADIDGDGYKECVRYYRDTTTIKRELFDPSGPDRACVVSTDTTPTSTFTMVENVLNSAEGLKFTYRDETDTTLCPPTCPVSSSGESPPIAKIRRVEVKVTLEATKEVTKIAGVQKQRVVETSIILRNLWRIKDM